MTVADIDYGDDWALDEEIATAANKVRSAIIEEEIAESLGLVIAGRTDERSDSGNDRARLRRARDMLIDVEDELLYVVKRDPALQPMIDAIIDFNLALTRRVE